MPIIPTDAISGSIYVVAVSAEDAKRRALDYLSGNEVRNVFDDKKDAVEFQRDPFRPSVDGERLYVVGLDIRLDPTK
ncbi:hypothetical protein [Streptomyces sp. NPDC086519]|uniref:hypothetical protein n=1 Tax=Streptomyces sp. NPDC086519 TaxID=3154863 RepID=UPI0034398E66